MKPVPINNFFRNKVLTDWSQRLSGDSICIILVGLVLVSASLGTDPMGFFIALLVLWSIVWCVLSWKKIAPLNRYEIAAIVILIAFFLWHQASRHLLAIVETRGGGYAHFLLVIIPLYLHMRQRRLSILTLARWGCVAVVVGLLSVTWQVLVQQEFRVNMLFGGHQIMFGDFLLSTTLMTAAFLFSWTVDKYRKVIFFLTLLIGLLCMVASGTRGSYIAAPLTLVLLMTGDYFIQSTHRFFSLRSIFISVFVFVILVFSVSQTDKGKYYVERFDSVADAVVAAGSLDFDSPRFQRIDMADQFRILMLVVAWEMFIDRPVTGHGWGSYSVQKQLYVEQLGILEIYPNVEDKDEFLGFNQPHNDYLRFASEQGLIGLFFILLLLCAPVWWFSLIVYSSRHTTETRIAALAGLLLSVAYVQFYMTESISGRSGMFGHQLFFLTVLTAQVARLKRKANVS